MDKTVCIDLDGTLASWADGWQGVGHIGDPIEGAKEFMEALKEEGFYIVVHSCRANGEFSTDKTEDIFIAVGAIRTWLVENKIPFDLIYGGKGKPVAVAYVDDRGVNCAPEKGLKAMVYAKAFQAVLELAAKPFDESLQDHGEVEAEKKRVEEDVKTALHKARQLLERVAQLAPPTALPPQTTQNEHGGVAVDVG